MDPMKMIKMFCGLGGPAVGSLIAPLLIPFCCCLCLCSCFIPMVTAPLGFWNASTTAPTYKDTNKAAIFSFAIYYPLAVIICYFMLKKACNVTPEQIESLIAAAV